MKRRDLLIGSLPLLVGPSAASAATVPALTDDAIAARLRAGRVAVLLRHSITDPGVGDPPGFRLDSCSTQRNLSAEGRAQAQRIGAWFKARGLTPAQVRSSAWCRCIDTATLAFGRVTPWAPLNSFFDAAGSRERQNAALGDALPGIASAQFDVWVTHQVNITALTGEFVQMGEAWLVLIRRCACWGASAPAAAPDQLKGVCFARFARMRVAITPPAARSSSRARAGRRWASSSRRGPRSA
jgi:hypothetical protein